MAYSIGGKVYTDNPLMDEICHNCKLILNGIVIKNDILANNSETENSVQNAEMLYIQTEDGYIPFSIFPFDVHILVAFGYSQADAIGYAKDKNSIPEEDRNALTVFANKYFKDNFEEENNYYRMLNGLPPYNTGEEYFIYLSKNYIPAKYNKEVDLTIPLHLQPKSVINILYNTKQMDVIRKDYPGSAYNYINYLGYKKIDIYKARKAFKWDILYMPNVNDLVEDKFTEFYKINREIYLNQSYQEAFAENSTYYDEMMILTVLSQTFADMITDVPEWYIRRDIFDIRSVKFFLDSYGIAFFKEIPLKYQINIVKNCNKLIKFKSSNENFTDITELFTKDNIKILKYWLLKKRLLDKDVNPESGGDRFVPGDSDEDKYELEFLSSPVDESFDAYIKDKIYRTPYDDITYQDKYWDGKDTHEFVKSQIINKDFIINGTKYMSIEYIVSLAEFRFEVSYMLGLILDSKVDLSDILIPLSCIDENAEFSLSNIFLYLIILSDSFYRDNINDHQFDKRVVQPINSGLPNVDPNEIDDWRMKNIPEIFEGKFGRVYAFNPDFDYDKMCSFIKDRRHSHYIFGHSYNNPDEDNPGADRALSKEEYAERASQALDDLMINDFIIPNGGYDTVEDVINIYRQDRRCYERLVERIKECDNEDDLSTLAYIFQEMYTREFDNDFYTLSDGTVANTIVEVLMDRDFILYDSYREIMQENNVETRKDQIRAVLNDVVETLEYYISGDGLDYLFGFTQVDSFFSIVYYIYLMIGFFKSYKVQFLDPAVTYLVDNKLDPLDGTIPTNDRMNELKVTTLKQDKQFTVDQLSIQTQMEFAENVNEKVEALDLYAYQDIDPSEDRDYNGFDAEKGEDPGYKDLDGGVADDLQNAPYEDIDAGRAYLERTDFNDINGGGADERYLEYHEINGGYAYHPEDERKDWFGTQGFNYDIDGGSADNKHFKSKAIKVDIKGNTVYMDIIPSPRSANHIMILEDGVYIQDFMVSTYEFNTIAHEFDMLRDEFDISKEGSIQDILNIDSFDDISAKIAFILSNILYIPLSCIDDTINNGLYNRFKPFVDGLMSYANRRYENTNPYGWVEL